MQILTVYNYNIRFVCHSLDESPPLLARIRCDNRVTSDMTERSGLAAPVTLSYTSGLAPSHICRHNVTNVTPNHSFHQKCRTPSPHNASFVNKIVAQRKGRDPMYANSHDWSPPSRHMNGISRISFIVRSTGNPFNEIYPYAGLRMRGNNGGQNYSS